MENKPIITCHGDQGLFSKLHMPVVQGLPREQVEWRRSYGRTPRTVTTEASFVPFNPDILVGDDEWTLLGRPFFHTYWTDCDIDMYKSVVKEEIAEWLAVLKSKDSTDWMIIVVVYDESKVKTKLLRSSVFDKIKTDFCSKQPDRCSILLEPFKADLKSGECWFQVLSRMRQLLLEAYSKCVSRFEDHMRAERERRTQTGWSFNSYFMLQEELAFMFEMLGLHEDALVQYDELDALFTQFILNHVVGASAAWIVTMLANRCTKWDGLCLAQPINTDKRASIRKNEASLLEFRNYLFSRQCTLLFLLSRPGEVAQRSIVFMHNCIQELGSLKIEMVPGAKESWIFLSCMEVLKKCEQFSKHGKMDVYSLHTASLWDYARTKIYELGLLCGVWPDLLTQSQHLELVVELMCGLSDEGEGRSEPLYKLKEALSSKTAFRKTYLELSELAMGTFKHIGRIRCARMIGKDLANFYMKVGEPQQAEGFLMDALKMFRREGWHTLADNTCVQLAQCQKLLAVDTCPQLSHGQKLFTSQHKYVTSCQHIASSSTLPLEVRLEYQEEILRMSQEIKGGPLLLRAEPVFTVTTVNQDHGPHQDHSPFTPFQDTSVSLTIHSHLPEPVLCDYAHLSLIHNKSRKRPIINAAAALYRASVATSLDMHAIYEVRKELQSTVVSSRMDCRTPMRRMDSGVTEAQVCKDDYTFALKAEGVRLMPGANDVLLKAKLFDVGSYSVSQLCVTATGLEFLHMITQKTAPLQVLCQQPTVSLQCVPDGLWLGLSHQLQLTIDTGSFSYTDATQMLLSTPPDLQLTPSTIVLPPVGCNQKLHFAVTAHADLASLSPSEVTFQVDFACDWFRNAHQILSFNHPFELGHKLYTAGKRKFIQVTVKAKGDERYILSTHSLTSDGGLLEVTGLNHPQQTLVIGSGEKACYVWRVASTENALVPVSLTFNVNFRPEDLDLPDLPCNYVFSVDHIQTLYAVETSVVPPPGMNLCSAGSMCDLLVDVQRLTGGVQPAIDSLFYQVRSDNYWAVCDSTAAGMCKLEMNQFRTHVCIRPLLGGYLPLPSVDLHHRSTSETSDKTNVESLSDVAFRVGEVYNRSAATQVHVLPATTGGLPVTAAT